MKRQHQLLYLGFSIHQEVASDSFCFLINSSWLLVFILYVFYLFFSGFNLYCWKGIHFSQNLDLIFLSTFVTLHLDLAFSSGRPSYPRLYLIRSNFIKTTYDISLDSQISFLPLGFSPTELCEKKNPKGQQKYKIEKAQRK